MFWHRQETFDSKGDKLSSSAECGIRTRKSQDTYSSGDWMPAHKPNELSRIQLKNWTQQSVPKMSEQTAHLTSLLFGFRTWLWRYTCLLLLISMLWHRQAIFESKGVSSSAECRIGAWKPQGTYSPGDWMPTHKPNRLSRIQLKPWTQQPVPMMNEHSVHLTSLPFGFWTWLWRYTCLLLLILMLWPRQATFETKRDKFSSSAECRIWTWNSQDTYWFADWMPTHKPPLSLMDFTAVWFSHLALAIYMFVVVNFDSLAQASGIPIERDKLSSSAECRIRTWNAQDTYAPADWMPTHKPNELSRIKLKTQRT